VLQDIVVILHITQGRNSSLNATIIIVVVVDIVIIFFSIGTTMMRSSQSLNASLLIVYVVFSLRPLKVDCVNALEWPILSSNQCLRWKVTGVLPLLQMLSRIWPLDGVEVI
jgi:hypothetical protein